MTTFADQVYQLGGSPVNTVVPPGAKAFYVHSGTGSSGNDGLSPDRPLATVDQAINKCTASKGDTIFVLPGHAETIAATNGFDADVAGIRIIGLGEGTVRPTFTFTATASQVNVGAASVTLQNLRFVAGVSAVVAGVQVEGVTDCSILDCEWYWGGTTGWDFVLSLELEAGSSRAKVKRCRFLGEPAVAGSASAIKMTGAGSDNVIIKDCEFMGDYDPAAVNGTAACEGLMFIDNLVHITNAGEPYLEVHASTTGVIARTMGLAAGATVAANAVAAAMMHCENYVGNTTGTIAIVKGAGGSPSLDAD